MTDLAEDGRAVSAAEGALELARGFGQDALDLFVEQLTPPFFSVGSQLYWTHIAAAFALALLVYARLDAAGRRFSPVEFRRLYLPGSVFWHPSARVDYQYYVINGVLYPLLVLPWLIPDHTLRIGVEERLTGLLGPRAPGASPGALTTIALSVAIFIAYDFGRWAGHYVQHRIPWLWEFHKVHHSAEVLTPMTNFRTHPVDLAVMATSTTLSVGAAAGVALYLFPGDAALFAEMSLRAALLLFILDLGGSLLRHSGVWLSYGPVLGRLLISPAQHQIHHSADARHFGKNLGFALAVWDWAFGTLYLTGRREAITYGAGDGDDAAYRSVVGLYAMPLRRLLRRRPSPGEARRPDAHARPLPPLQR